MEPIRQNSRQEGSIADVCDRLAIWIRNAPRGLARIEYVSDLSRQRVVNELRRRLASESIPLNELDLPRGMAATELARHFVKRLGALPPGVVSVMGFATALPNEDTERAKALYALNFSRENLAQFPLRQIWWMPGHIADAFIRAIPDLNSWFLIKLRLTEIVRPPEPDKASGWMPGAIPVSLDDARKRAAMLAERFTGALNQGVQTENIFEEIAIPAIQALLDAGAEKEAWVLAQRFDETLAAASRPRIAYPESRGLILTKTLQRAEAELGPDHPVVAKRLNNLAKLLYESARYAEAEPLLRRALAIDEASFGPDHPSVATDLNNLAQLLQDTNRLAEAEPLLRRALAIDEASFGPDHPNVARDLNNLASLLKATNRLADAESLMRRALAIDETSLGFDHPSFAIHLNNLAQLLKATNRLAEAEPLLRRALAIDEASLGPDHPKVARDLNNLASLLQATNRLADAEPFYRRALAIDEASLGPDHPNVGRDLNNLASLL